MKYAEVEYQAGYYEGSKTIKIDPNLSDKEIKEQIAKQMDIEVEDFDYLEVVDKFEQ